MPAEASYCPECGKDSNSETYPDPLGAFLSVTKAGPVECDQMLGKWRSEDTQEEEALVIGLGG